MAKNENKLNVAIVWDTVRIDLPPVIHLLEKTLGYW